MTNYRKVFPCYLYKDLDLVNQIINLDFTIRREEIVFVKEMLNKKIKSEKEIRRWINENMNGCCCLIIFIGEDTHTSPWVKYEMELARERNIGRFIIYLEGMKNKDQKVCGRGIDPYFHHNLYTNMPNKDNYRVRKYSWIKDNGYKMIRLWIEDACKRAGK